MCFCLGDVQNLLFSCCKDVYKSAQQALECDVSIIRHVDRKTKEKNPTELWYGALNNYQHFTLVAGL